jgi:hypothetical protein
MIEHIQANGQSILAQRHGQLACSRCSAAIWKRKANIVVQRVDFAIVKTEKGTVKKIRRMENPVFVSRSGWHLLLRIHGLRVEKCRKSNTIVQEDTIDVKNG